jgi:inosine-uridine nucleoside N-ribohydrolase
MSSTLRGFAVAGLLTGLSGLCTEPARAEHDKDRHSRHVCVVVDTDAATDDFRALAVLFPNRDIRAVVVTEGIASVPRGSTAIALFMASGQSLAPVIPGLAAAAPPTPDWLPLAREAAEQLNTFLDDSVPFAASSDNLKLALLKAVKGCRRVDVVVLGPWSSFVEYARMLRPLVRQVVASGRPVKENDEENFNCLYDQPACDRADEILRRFRSAVWVDLPRGEPPYAPTEEMVDQLAGAGMPGLLRAALKADVSQWSGTRLWDDTAALYLLAPEHFARKGGHFEPIIDEETLRSELVEATNAAPAD